MALLQEGMMSLTLKIQIVNKLRRKSVMLWFLFTCTFNPLIISQNPKIKKNKNKKNHKKHSQIKLEAAFERF